MGLPNINISFKTAAAAAIARSQKGVVGLILRDAATGLAGKGYRMTAATDIPTTLGADNQGYIRRAFTGYITPPREVIAYVLAVDAENLNEGLAYFATLAVDYLCGPHDCTEAEGESIASWVKSRRAEDYTVKAVLPLVSADSDGVVNFGCKDIKAGTVTYTAAQYCSRIAGLIAGTPMTISCTYAPLPEVADIERLSKSALDDAIDAGHLMLYHDGEKVKVARGVNSMITATADKGEAFKKIKIVEAADMIRHDLSRTCQDSYIGKYANSYDNKCLLISAIKGYFESLELEGILDKGKSTVALDVSAQSAYLKGQGVDTTKLNEQQIKEANTGDKVFIACTTKILDAIEDISIGVVI